jgi:hypothetical protein
MIGGLVLLLMALPQQNAPVLTAELIPRTARVGEAVILRVSVQSRGNASPRVQMPTLHPDLHVVGTQDFTETSFGSGSRLTTTRREFVLLPQAAGTFSIPAIRVTMERRVLRTEPMTLQITDATRDPEPPAGNPDARVLVRMEPETVYVGQQSTLVGEVLLTPDLQMRLTRPPSYDAPAPVDFWIHELQPDPSTEMRVIDGQRFIVQRFYRAYFPLNPGRYAFAPARVTYEARQGFLFAPQTRELRSSAPELTVLPVPEQSRPRNFRGAVGALSMRAHIEPASSAVGDAVSLIVALSGNANVKALPAPQLPSLPGFEVLDPSESAEVDARTHQLGGTKQFTWVLVPEREGTFDLPPIEYSSFDPVLGTFRSHVADAGTLTIRPAGTNAPVTMAALKPRPEPDPTGWIRSPLLVTLQAVPVVFLALGLLARRRRAGPAPRLKRAWDQRLAALRSVRTNPLNHAERLLRDVLAEVVPTARVRSGSPAELHRDLQRLVSVRFADQVARVLERLENARYAPGELDPSARQTILSELEEVLDGAWRHARAAARSHAALVPVVLALMQANAPADAFERGVQAYREREFTSAIQQFEHYLQAAPRDPAGWYNLAVALEADRQPARAAWAWLHVIELRPRDRVARSELTRLGAWRLGQRVRPLLQLNTNETLFFASALWWGAAAILALALARRSRSLARIGAAPLALIGLLLLLWAGERMLPPPALVLDRGAALLAGQNLHADIVRQLQPMSAVTIMEDENGWTRVRTPAGETGWVSSDGIGRL